jgi:hypothetical protein
LLAGFYVNAVALPSIKDRGQGAALNCSSPISFSMCFSAWGNLAHLGEADLALIVDVEFSLLIPCRKLRG